MQSVAEQLRIKFGLDRIPTSGEVAEWRSVTENFIREGEPSEKAGEIAAQQVFPSFRSRVFKSEADNIVALLRALAQK